jgi:hypothetical protein
MRFDIEPLGNNLIQNNNNYNFIPYTFKNKVIIKIYENFLISFVLTFSSNIKYLLIKIKNNDITINNNNTALSLYCNNGDMINIIPIYHTEKYSETDNTYSILNLTITEKTEKTIITEKTEKNYEITEKNYEITEREEKPEKEEKDYEIITTENFSNKEYFIPEKRRRIIITLSVIPNRLMTIEFYNNIKKISNCELKPDYIIINFCKKYKRKFTFEYEKCIKMLNILKQKFSNLIINICKDYGPITKIFGLFNLDKQLTDEDIIISIDDDWEYDTKISLFYYYCYEIYDCDCVFIDEKYNISLSGRKINFINNQNIFYDNYQNFVYGWLSFSFKYGKLKKIKKFYNSLITLSTQLWIHDDLILTLYYKKYRLKACGISIVFNIKRENNIINIDALKNMKNAHFTRRDLEIYFLKLHEIEYKNINNLLLYIKNIPYENEYILEENTLDKVINIKSDNMNIYKLSENICILISNDKEDKILNYKNEEIRLNLKSNNFSQYSSYIIKFNNIQLIKNSYNSKTFYNEYKDFLETYKLNNMQANEQKNTYRYFCYKYLPEIEKIKLPIIKQHNKKESVLIEFRILPHLEFLIRNTIIKLGEEWSHTVICGNMNYDYIKTTCKKITENIKIIKLEYDNIEQSEYSLLLSEKSFWELLEGEKILIYQEDSCIFKYNIEEFIEWDYIGAPWKKINNDNEYCVGNGGFSLRSKQTMIEIIEKISIKETKFNSSTLSYMKNTGQTIGPEDVYFTKNMIEYKIGKLAPWKIAKNFSTEWIYNSDSLGGHCFWYCDNNWLNNLFERIFS